MFTLTNTAQTFAKFSDSLTAARGVSGAQADITLEGDALGGIVSGSYPEGVKVRGADGQVASGQWGSGARIYATDSYLVESRTSSQVLIEGITLHAQGDYAPSCVRTDHWYGADIHFKDCLIGHGSRISGSRYVFQMRNYGHRQRIYVENCVIHTSSALHGFDQPDSDVELVLKNCTLIDCNWRGRAAGAINTDSSKLKLINCYIHSTVGPALEGLQFAELTHCATSDGTAYGLGALTNVAPEDVVVDRAAKDFRLKPGNVLQGKGQDGSHIGATLGFDEPVQPPANQTITATDIALSLSAELEAVADGAAALDLGDYSFALMSEPPGVSGGHIEAHLPTADFSLYGTAEAVAEGSMTVSVLDSELALFAQVEGEQQSSGLLQVVGIPDSALSLYGEVTRLTAGAALVSLPEAALQLSTDNPEAFGYGDVSLFCADSSLSLVLDVPVVFDKALADLLAVDELDGVFRLGHVYSANFINSNQLTGSFKAGTR